MAMLACRCGCILLTGFAIVFPGTDPLGHVRDPPQPASLAGDRGCGHRRPRWCSCCCRNPCRRASRQSSIRTLVPRTPSLRRRSHQGLYDGNGAVREIPSYRHRPRLMAAGHRQQARIAQSIRRTLRRDGRAWRAHVRGDSWLLRVELRQAPSRAALRDPDGCKFVRASSGSAVAMSIFLLLFKGNFGHNLFRHNWLWFGGFLILATLCG